MRINFSDNWEILQDVHGNGEKLLLQNSTGRNTDIGSAVSDWEPLKELKHLQLLYDEHPYFGRQLRYFNGAPWWYRRVFTVPSDAGRKAYLHFSNVDYYAKVWLNGTLLGEHEGYMLPFEFDVSDRLLFGESNTLIVKVWSPWDETLEKDRMKDRTFSVERRMVKGTYEHADTFIQRDVNPVGIYGDVYLDIPEEISVREPEITYDLDLKQKKAKVTAAANVEALADREFWAELTVTDPDSGREVLRTKEEQLDSGMLSLSGITDTVDLWYVWDQGDPKQYEVALRLGFEEECSYVFRTLVGFRSISLERTPEMTRAVLNGRPFYVRGTSYFPDVYISNMTPEKYRRDLLRIRAAGFNFIRLHVHTELPAFYEICSELGLGVMQDSEFNWMHPNDGSYDERFVSVFQKTIRMLRHHTSIFFWVCMNEPGIGKPEGFHCRLMDVSPGPALYAAAIDTDPTRSVIKGSCWEDDPLSGDSHNYTGSIGDGDTVSHYSDIYGTTEKFNTEYGFDAPPGEEALKTEPRLYERLKDLVPHIGEIQNYQYKLLKYYTEHYRMQKHEPNNGYVQFLFSDLCLQSFYGIYDHLGNPKKGLQAMMESNMPVGVFLKHKDRLDEIHVVNDLPYDLGECVLSWRIHDSSGKELGRGSKNVFVDADCNITAWTFEETPEQADRCVLELRNNGGLIYSNHYEELFRMPPHTKDHPHRMDHELGCRLYFV